MKQLERIVLVQFFLFEAEEIAIAGDTAWLGPNGAGKTSLLDSVQIALLGAHQGYLKFNTQSLSTTRKKNYRSVRDYCLGVVRRSDGETGNGETSRRRDVAGTYISLVFRDDQSHEPITVGVALHAQHDVLEHTVKGLYVLPGVELRLQDHMEAADGETVPLHWKDFEQELRRKSNAAGRTPVITDKTDAYIREMLHSLQPKAKHINPRDFMKAFKKSVTLRDIESVNDFVRDFVVEAHPIDKHKAMAQITEFRKLDQLVKVTLAQIQELTALEKRYERLAGEHRATATMDYLIANYGQKELTRKAEEIETSVAREAALAAEREATAERLKRKIDEIRESIAVLERELNADPDARNVSEMEARLRDAETSRRGPVQNLDRTRRSLAESLDKILAIPGIRATLVDVEPTVTQLAALGRAVHTDPDAFGTLLLDAIEMVAKAQQWVEHAHPNAQHTLRTKEEHLRKLLATYQAMNKHGVRLSDDPSSAIALLAQRGIEATPVCSVVRVTQHEWQPAIEAYLGRNRESLIISDRRERDAVRVLRALPARERLYDATIVQPEHLREFKWHDPESVLVGSLIEGNSDVAVTYVRMLLGKMRMVDTEEELERHHRSLTVDGMLSANGGTRPLRLISPVDFKIGTRIPEARKKALQEEIESANREHQAAESYFKAVDAGKRAIDGLGVLERVTETVSRACDEVASLDRRIADLARRKADLEEDSSIVALRQTIAAREEEFKRYEEERAETDRAAAGHTVRASEQEKALADLRPALESANLAVEAALKDPDYDPALAQRLVTEHASRQNASYEWRVHDCTERRERARAAVMQQMQRLAPDFDKYLALANVTLMEERTDWRKAWAWVSAERDRLEGTQLGQYQAEAEEAKAKAEKAFREDIVVRISEAVQRTKSSLRELDKVLNSCPPFSNGERYAFEAKPAAAYKSLYDYIEKASKGTDPALGHDRIHEEIIAYLQQSVDPEAAKMPNPLDDYRLLFNFDLLIKQNDKVIGRLSQRIGPGSNGEHRTPFYVIAGAALAAAYRLRSGEANTGAALMLLDEAFYAMDSQNSLAAARFLKQLGLQLLIGAPDDQFGKFAAICDTVYEMMRFELDIFMECTRVKKDAQGLMTSDMPSEHPYLIDEMVAELESSRA